MDTATGFLEYVERSSDIEDLPSLCAHFQDELERTGFDQIAYSLYGGLGLDPTAEVQVRLVSCNEGWLSHYFEQGYARLDPVTDRVFSSMRAFTWATLRQEPGLSKQQKTILEESREGGLFNGLSVPVYGRRGEVGAINLAASVQQEHSRHDLIAVTHKAIHFHTMYSEIVREQEVTHGSSDLTTREQEVLKWIVAGKTNWEISQILHVSEDTIKFHVKGVMEKLNAPNRLLAAVMAIYRGQVRL